MSFPKGFLWGTSVSAAQIEGGWDEGGKSPVMLDYAGVASSHTGSRPVYYLSAKAAKIAHSLDPSIKVGAMICGACSYPLTPDPKGIDGFRFFRQVERKNPLALYRLKRFTRQAARFIVDLQLMLDLETIAIGGGVSAQPRFIQEIQKALDQEWKSYWVRITRVPKPEIKVASAGNDANLIGALIHFQAMERGHL